MTDKIFLTDIDNCVLDWNKKFSEYVRKISPNTVIDFSVYTLGLEQEERNKLLLGFNSSRGFGDIPILDDAHKYIQKIHDEFGYKFVAITSCQTTEQSVELRLKQMARDFPGLFTKVHCLEIGQDKGNILQSYEASFWVDDMIEHCKEGQKYNHRTLHYGRPHNVDDYSSGILRVKNWKEIYQHVKAEEQKIFQNLKLPEEHNSDMLGVYFCGGLKLQYLEMFDKSLIKKIEDVQIEIIDFLENNKHDKKIFLKLKRFIKDRNK